MRPLTETSPHPRPPEPWRQLPELCRQPFRGITDPLRPIGLEQGLQRKEVRPSTSRYGVWPRRIPSGVPSWPRRVPGACPDVAPRTGRSAPPPTPPNRPPPPARTPDPAAAGPCRRTRCPPRQPPPAGQYPLPWRSPRPAAREKERGQNVDAGSSRSLWVHEPSLLTMANEREWRTAIPIPTSRNNYGKLPSRCPRVQGGPRGLEPLSRQSLTAGRHFL